MKIAIIGAGPAGAYLACSLAQGRYKKDIVLIDPKMPWEKTTGISVSHQLISEFLLLSDFKRSEGLMKIRFVGPRGMTAEVQPAEPLFLTSRDEIGGFLVDRVMKNGIEFISERVKKLELDSKKGEWSITTANETITADFLVGADGAATFIRRELGLDLNPAGTTMSAGYRLPQMFDNEATIHFLGNMNGYIWVLPRKDYSSVGIIATGGGLHSSYLFERLDNFIKEYFTIQIPDGIERRGGIVPAFGGSGRKQFMGKNWALIGEAARLVDPITKEGIYFGLKSASLLARAISQNNVGKYYDGLKKEILPNFTYSSHISRLFYRPAVLERVIKKSHKNNGARRVMIEFVTGTKRRHGFKRNLVTSFLSRG